MADRRGRESVGSSEFWNAAGVHNRMESIEDELKLLHKRFSDMKSRAWFIAGSVSLPLLSALAATWILSSSASENATAASVIGVRHEREIEALEEQQTAIREGVAAVRANQATQSVTQERILDELRNLNGG